MKVLMHICCSNCCIYPVQKLFMDGLDITGFWFNPNIHPYTEYKNRLDSLERLQKLWNMDIEYLDEYPLDDFLKSIAGTGSGRCEICYSNRLEKTAVAAKKMQIPFFTTSLLASPYQKFDRIVELGRIAGRRNGVEFIARDLREGWHRSKDLSREFALYRQKYCGCIYSEMERYQGKKSL